MKINEYQIILEIKISPVASFTLSFAWKGSPYWSYHNNISCQYHSLSIYIRCLASVSNHAGVGGSFLFMRRVQCVHSNYSTSCSLECFKNIAQRKDNNVFGLTHAFRVSPHDSNKFGVKISVFFPWPSPSWCSFMATHILEYLWCTLISFDRRCSKPSFYLKGRKMHECLERLFCPRTNCDVN